MNTEFPTNNVPIKLYRNPLSRHCNRAELMMALLDIPYQTIDLDMFNGAHKAEEYLKISPFDQVPAIDDNNIILSDSNAIVVYLEKKYNDNYAWMPQDPVKAAEVQRWLSIAAGEIAYCPCAVRLVKVFNVDLGYDTAKQKTDALFAALKPLIENRHYLTGKNINLADIAACTFNKNRGQHV